MPVQTERFDQSWILATDTSTDQVGLVLSSIGESGIDRQAELTWPAARKQTKTLLNEIDHLMKLCEIETAELGAVAVAIGPGSFNALRVGLSTAKALCFGLGIPIIGIGTLDAAAHSYRSFGYPVRAFVDAGRGRVVAGDFTTVENQMILVNEMVHFQRGELARGLMEPTILAGRLNENEIANLQKQPNVMIPDEARQASRSRMLIDIAINRWRANLTDDLFQLEPVYIHARTGVSV